MSERSGEASGRGVVEAVKGWVRRTFGKASRQGPDEREGPEQQGGTERDAVFHETEAARARAEAEVREARQEGAERLDPEK